MRLVVFRWLQNIFLALAKQLDGARKWLSISEKRFNLFGTATGAVEVMKQWRFYDLMSNVFTPPLQRNFPLASKSSKLIFAINWNRISPLRMSLEFCFIPRASSQRKYCRIIHKAKQTFCLLFGIPMSETKTDKRDLLNLLWARWGKLHQLAWFLCELPGVALCSCSSINTNQVFIDLWHNIICCMSRKCCNILVTSDMFEYYVNWISVFYLDRNKFKEGQLGVSDWIYCELRTTREIWIFLIRKLLLY